MKYKYSIYHSDSPEVECPDKILSKEEVMEIAKNHPWSGELEKLGVIPLDKIYNDPSIEFTNLNNNYSIDLSVLGETDNYYFYVRYVRPIKTKVLFGIFGEEVKFKEIDKQFSKEKSFELLENFLNEKYDRIENEMQNAEPYLSEIERREEEAFWKSSEWTIDKILMRLSGYGFTILFFLIALLFVFEGLWEGILFSLISIGIGFTYIRSDIKILVEKRRRKKLKK